MHDTMFKSAISLYDVPTERKQKLECNFLALAMVPIIPGCLCELFGIENGTNIEGTKNFASLMWHEGNDQFWRDIHGELQISSPIYTFPILGPLLLQEISLLSNGRIYAPIHDIHEVVITGDKAKYSIGQFLFSNATIEVPPELVDDENPLKFKPFNHLEFLKYCKEGGQTMSKSAIETYCGI
ncbi:probable 2-oxoglutarate-dependent dioxygenase AOP1 [Olea europaea subsp. europaea]|uniref:Probable 2-oxoglutarate-dependent dioxygenase AOP1 n=1 Tax=Olea europaea subsp. europaea TaxID=158383 RepID=A0A8S0VDB3_OLEEU|nr:probable 2-oxoglutarate-dependent dioxygenase AOP1 [Olea europaea subsp. europaea]